MEERNVTIKADGTRIETERIARSNGGAKVTTTVVKPCGCRTTTSRETGDNRYGSSGHSSHACGKHAIRSWNGIPSDLTGVLIR